MNSNLQFAGLTDDTLKPQTINADTAWAQLVRRDTNAKFFFGVLTTGVFCRPGCASRSPLKANVRFFGSAEAARAAGFRACLRCKPGIACCNPLDELRRHIEKNVERAVPLAELGRVAGLSPFTVQRMFKEAMGVSPLQYQRALRASGLRAALKHGDSVTNAIYDAGFGASSRAYEGAGLGMTPGRFAAGGAGESIGFTTAHSPFGWLIVGATQRGLCWLALAETEAEAERTLRAEFPAATLQCDESLAHFVDAALAEVNGQIASVPLNEPPAQTAPPQVTPPARSAAPEVLDLRGTAFQLRVWQALRAIPRGETRSYSQLAREMGDPQSTRAVARACAMNRVALLVPCHRVVGKSGSLTGYRWGMERKRQILEAEAPAK